MDTHLLKKFSDVLCTLVYSESLQFVLRRASPMSAQLQILVVDRITMTVRDTINTMMFEGVSKDDLNYHMIVYYRPAKTAMLRNQRIGQGGEDGEIGGGYGEPGGQLPGGGGPKDEDEEVNQLILFYPNGIIAIYDNILQQGGGIGRRKVHLKEVLQAEYEAIMAPQILRDKLIFVSWQNVPAQASHGKQAQVPQGPILVSIEMDNFRAEIAQKKTMSCREVQIVRILDQLAQVQGSASAPGQRGKKAPPQPDFSKFQDLKLTDMSCSIISSSLEGNIGDFSSQWDIQCFLSFNNGQILQYSFRNQYRKNKVFSVQKFADTPIFKQALSEADVDAQYPAGGKAGQPAKQMITCLDFLDLTVSSGSQQVSDEEDNHLGFLLLGDTQGFIYIVSLSKLEGNEDQLVYMCCISQSGSSDPHSVIAAKWISWLDVKFAVMTADGDLAVYDFLINREDQLSLDQVYISKLHQQQTFEELNQTFQFCDISQLGNQSIQAFPDTAQRPGFTTDNLSLLWPSRILRKHDIKHEIAGSKDQAAQDKIITQMTLYQFSVSSLVYPLRINGSLGGYKIQRAPEQGKDKRDGQVRDPGYQEGLFGGSVVFCSGISSNGPAFLHQMQLDEMIPEHLDDQLACPRQYENVFFIDEVGLSISAFSNITGKQQALFSIKRYVFKDLDEIAADSLPRVAFTDLQVRQNFETGIMKFLVSWINPMASGTDTKYLFTWIAYDFIHGAVIQDQSNEDQPKLGIYASFLVGTPNQYDGSSQVFYDNTNESIVCLDRDLSSTISGSSSLGDRSNDVAQQNAGASLLSTSKLRIYQFDPFLDSREVNLHVKVLQMYPTPLRRGKVLLYYNISENMLQFSKNKSESKYAEDDYGLYVNRKYSWKLAPDERVLDVKWIGAVEPVGKAAAGDDVRSALTGSAQGSEHKKQSVRVVILTYQRIYVADKNFVIAQNFGLLQQQRRLIVRSLTVIAGVTILFSTDHHLYYLTQEKGNQQVQASGIVMSFQRTDPKNREQVVGALGDRVVLVSRETISGSANQQPGGRPAPTSSQIKFAARNIQLLEPLLLGYLATLSHSRLKSELDVDLVQRACRFLDTNQISQNLPLKLSQCGLLNSQMFLNQNALQFDILPKLNAFCEIQKAQAQKQGDQYAEESFYAEVDTLLQFLVHLFPNKDIDTRPQIFGQNPQPEVSASALEERNDVILKLHNDQSFCLERRILVDHLRALKDVLAAQSSRKEASGTSLLFALSLCELLSNWQLSLSILKAFDQVKGSVGRGQGHFQRFVELLRASNEQGQYDEILWYAQQNLQPGRQGFVEIMEHRCLSWHEKLWDIILAPGEGGPRRLSLLYPQKSAESCTLDQPIQRLNVPFGETAFVYYVQSTPIKAESNRQGGPAGPTMARPLGAVVAESMGNWLGHDNIIEQHLEIEEADGGMAGDRGPGLAAGFVGGNARGDQHRQHMQEGPDPALDEDKDIGSDVGADDLDEAKNVLFYLRMDEGQGELIHDITDNKFQCRFSHNADALNTVGRRSAWSESVLDESDRPVDLDDKWGKQNQPQYSVDIGLMQDGCLPCASNSGKMPSRLTNFTLEFWLRIPESQRSIHLSAAGGAVDILLDQQGGMQVLLAGEKQPPSDAARSVNPAAWTHLAIVYSQKSSLKVFVNAQLASKSSKKLSPIPAPQPFPVIQVPQDRQLQMCEITEVRMWSCCLNRGIIGENHTVPLALLYEQKRRVRVEIQKKKKGLGGGLGKLGGAGKTSQLAQRFGTMAPQSNQKLLGLGKSKLDKGGGNQQMDLLGMSAATFQTNMAARPAELPEQEADPPMSASQLSSVQQEAPADSFFQFDMPADAAEPKKSQDAKVEVVPPAAEVAEIARVPKVVENAKVDEAHEPVNQQNQESEAPRSKKAQAAEPIPVASPKPKASPSRLKVNSKVQAYRLNQQKELEALQKVKKAKRRLEKANHVLDECLAPLLSDLITMDAILDSKGPARFQLNLARLANALYTCRDQLAPLADLPSILYFTLSIQKRLTALQKKPEYKIDMPEQAEDSDTEEVDEEAMEKQHKITEAAEDKAEEAPAIDDDAKKRYAELDDDEEEGELLEHGDDAPATEAAGQAELEEDGQDAENLGDENEEGPVEQALPSDTLRNETMQELAGANAPGQEMDAFFGGQDEDHLQDLLDGQDEEAKENEDVENAWRPEEQIEQEGHDQQAALATVEDEAILDMYLQDSHAVETKEDEDLTNERQKEEFIKEEKPLEGEDVTPPQKGEPVIPVSEEQVRVPAFSEPKVEEEGDDSILKEGGSESDDAGDQALGTDLQQDEEDRQNVPLVAGSDDSRQDSEQEETEEDRLRVCFQRASLSTLFLRVIDKLRPLYGCDTAPQHVSVFAKILILRLLNLSLEANMSAGQYGTCQRIVEALEKTFQDIYFDEDEQDFLVFRNLLGESKAILEEDKIKNGGVTLNYGTLVAKQMKQGDQKAALDVQCPQCQSDLPFGIAQEKCFDCMAELTVCQHAVEQLFDEEAFVASCFRCRGKFGRSYAQEQGLGGKFKCPVCQTAVPL